MGLLHSMFYRGDILHIYAILGFPLILLYKVNNKVLIALAALLIIEVPILYHLAYSFMDPAYTFIPDWGGTYFQECEDAYAYGSLWEVMNANLWKGRYLVYAWTFYTGRAVQLFALFIIGLLIGRGRYFEEIEKYRKQITRVLALSIVFILVLHYASLLINNAVLSELQKELLTMLVGAFNNLAYTGAIVSLFILAYLKFGRNVVFLSLATYGKMSLTNYVLQALVGVTLFYGFGFGLWRYLGATWSLLAGMVFFFIQLSFSRYWVSHYLYGPLEWIWRSITLLDYHLPIRRSDVPGKAT
jgi:uncharacterized protein